MTGFSLVLRYVPESDGVPVQHCIEFIRGASQTTAAMEQLLVKKLAELGIPLVEDNIMTVRLMSGDKEGLKGERCRSNKFFLLVQT